VNAGFSEINDQPAEEHEQAKSEHDLVGDHNPGEDVATFRYRSLHDQMLPADGFSPAGDGDPGMSGYHGPENRDHPHARARQVLVMILRASVMTGAKRLISAAEMPLLRAADFQPETASTTACNVALDSTVVRPKVLA